MHLSSGSSSGYRGVGKLQGCGSTSRSTAPPATNKGVREINKTGRFRADGRTAYGKPVSFGTFATAVDAAVAHAQAVAEMEGAESIAEDATITPRRAEKRPLEAARAPPPKRRSREIPGVPSLSPSSSSPRASPSSSGASSGPASTSGATFLPPSRLFKLLPDGRTVHREPPPSTGGIAAVAAALARIGLQAYVAAFDAEGYDDIEYLRGLDAAERAEVATETDMKPGHAGRWGKYGFGEI